MLILLRMIDSEEHLKFNVSFPVPGFALQVADGAVHSLRDVPDQKCAYPRGDSLHPLRRSQDRRRLSLLGLYYRHHSDQHRMRCRGSVSSSASGFRPPQPPISSHSARIPFQGGLKAAILADVIQGLIMIACSLSIIIQGVIDTDGVDYIVRTNYNHGRLKFFKWVGPARLQFASDMSDKNEPFHTIFKEILVDEWAVGHSVKNKISINLD